MISHIFQKARDKLKKTKQQNKDHLQVYLHEKGVLSVVDAWTSIPGMTFYCQ